MRWLFILMLAACSTETPSTEPDPGSARPVPEGPAPDRAGDGGAAAPMPDPDASPAVAPPIDFRLPEVEGPGPHHGGISIAFTSAVHVSEAEVTSMEEGFVLGAEQVEDGVVPEALRAIERAVEAAGEGDSPHGTLFMDPRAPVETTVTALRTATRAGLGRIDLITRVEDAAGASRYTTVPIRYADAVPDEASTAVLSPTSLRLAWSPTSTTRVGTQDVPTLRKSVAMARDRMVALRPGSGATYGDLIVVADALIDAGASGVVVVPGEGLAAHGGRPGTSGRVEPTAGPPPAATDGP